jgi:hypothetical protein
MEKNACVILPHQISMKCFARSFITFLLLSIGLGQGGVIATQVEDKEETT